jgi:hypothetical protein
MDTVLASIMQRGFNAGDALSSERMAHQGGASTHCGDLLCAARRRQYVRDQADSGGADAPS